MLTIGRSLCLNILFLSFFFSKRYCWKLVYIYMLGYSVDFGHMEMINLLSSPSFKDKSVGWDDEENGVNLLQSCWIDFFWVEQSERIYWFICVILIIKHVYFSYMAISLLFRPGDDMMTLVVNSVRFFLRDMKSWNEKYFYYHLSLTTINK